MPLVNSLKEYLANRLLRSVSDTDPERAYDIWALDYDRQPGNLMLEMDEKIFSSLIQEITIRDKVLADIGCGTGRHWTKLMLKAPKKLLGYDVSQGMLDRLQQKFPQAETHRLSGNSLQGLDDESCDIIISTLTIAHIEKFEEAMREWNRVVKPGGHIIITDYHPEALASGGKRTFRHADKLISVKNFVHPMSSIREIASQIGWEEIIFHEKKIDAEMKQHYIQQGAEAIYEKFKGIRIIFGMLLKKKDAVE